MAGDFTFGIEEEYFLVDARTKLAVRSMPETFFKAAEAAADGRISREFLQAQIEVITSPHARMADARAELRHLRHAISAVAGGARSLDPGLRHASDRRMGYSRADRRAALRCRDG